MRLGVSSGVLADKNRLEDLLVYAPEVVEFYNYPSLKLKMIERFCSANSIQPALHVPVPYNGNTPLRRFSPTGPEEDEVRHAVSLTLATIDTAVALGALHVVIHFPSPYPLIEAQLSRDRCARFLDPVQEYSVRRGVRAILENMSSHPSFFHADHYQDVLNDFPKLGLCLDIGHAHLLAPTVRPDDFIDAVGDKIWSCHCYNTTVLRYARFGQEPPDCSQSEDDGWVNLPRLFGKLHALQHLEVAVVELKSGTLYSADSMRWLRSLIATPTGSRRRHGSA